MSVIAYTYVCTSSFVPVNAWVWLAVGILYSAGGSVVVLVSCTLFLSASGCSLQETQFL